MAQIASIKAREILDSRCIPTLAGQLITKEGIIVHAKVPSGESLGKHEGVELRDKDPSRYVGMGVQQAMAIINESIAPMLVNVDTIRFQEIDEWLVKADGTNNFSKLGVNTLMIISQLVFKTNAAQNMIPPAPFELRRVRLSALKIWALKVRIMVIRLPPNLDPPHRTLWSKSPR